MNREETAKILTMLRIAYPNFAKDMKKPDAERLTELWQMCFESEPYGLVSLAVKELIEAKKDFAPDIAAVKERIASMRAVIDREPSNDELWRLLHSAASRSAYNSEEEFSRLPKLLQDYLHHPSELKALSQVPEDEFSTVIKGIFFKNIEVTRRRARESEHLSEYARLSGVYDRPMVSGV